MHIAKISEELPKRKKYRHKINPHLGLRIGNPCLILFFFPLKNEFTNVESCRLLSSLKFGRMEGLLKQGDLATKCRKFWNLYDIIVTNQDFYFYFFAMVLFCFPIIF